MRDCPNLKGSEKGGQAQESGSSDCPDVVNGMLKVFSIDAYVLLDLGATLSFFTPVVAKKFDILPDIFHEPFLVSTPVGESVVAKKGV